MHEENEHHGTGLAWGPHLMAVVAVIAALSLAVAAVDLWQPISAPAASVLLVVFPLVAFTVQMLIGRFLPRKGDWVSLTAIFLSCVLGTWIFLSVLRGATPAQTQVQWFKVGGQSLKVGVLLDGLTACMLFIVTFIGGLIHLYSVGYMHGDPRYGRFFGFLSLFCFSMLGLVVTDNLLLLYVFWELVGVSSYFLIGFWFEKRSAADACKKAFLTNRVGDIGFFIGLGLLYRWTDTLSMSGVFEALPRLLGDGTVTPLMLTVAGLLVFCGAVGKSAQFPLHVWLPDAMEGPTPVSALIHAATMVAAGVYMVGRLYPIFTPDAFLGIALIGLITAFFAGTIALAQNDIKRVLAYSTVSQLGYMIMSLGVGGFTAGLFHLSTHAFFKALLFLCAGSVIHAAHTQDMREMGGLRHKAPITFFAMLVGTLAICGFPFTSGFYSKDAILEAAYEFGHLPPMRDGILWLLLQKGFFWVALVAAGVTAFYSFRLIWMTFFGEPRNREKYDHAHESPWTMTAPLIVLAVFAVSAGWGFSAGESGHPWASTTTRIEAARQVSAPSLALIWGRWYSGVVERPELPVMDFYRQRLHRSWAGLGPAAAVAHGAAPGGAHQASPHGAGKDHTPSVLAVLVVFAGIFLSIPCFLTRSVTLETIQQAYPGLGRLLGRIHTILENKYYVDELYEAVFVKPLLELNARLARFDLDVIDGVVNWVARAGVRLTTAAGWADLNWVDGLVNKLADATLSLGERVRGLQAGVVQGYLVWTFWFMMVLLFGLQFL
ncbi:MAG: NADH-quinone oxidoreductase subunit L [Candidatus Riflebacteria bacterium]|nr:NADH-quinone oxidoreductase subunit L [Candidatus Riflebacteria bacterium]